MSYNYVSNIKDDLLSQENLRSLVYISEKENQILQKEYLHQIIIGVEDYENTNSLINIFNGNSKIILSKISEQLFINIKYINYIVFHDDSKMYQLILMENKDVENYLKIYKRYIIAIDKDNILEQKDSNEVLSNNWFLPNKDDFIEECIDFFIELVQIGLNYEEGNYIKANILKNSMEDRLIYIINTYLSIKYKNGIKVNQYGLNFKTYLENEYYEDFIYIIESNGNTDLWTALFKSAQLYRALALNIANTQEYVYPKKEDVETMKTLRKIYNKEKR